MQVSRALQRSWDADPTGVVEFVDREILDVMMREMGPMLRRDMKAAAKRKRARRQRGGQRKS